MSVMLYEDPKLAALKSKLKKARIAKGYTQDMLSELSNINLKSIAAYEQDPSKFSVANYKTVKRVADSLGVDPIDIINEETIWDDEND